MPKKSKQVDEKIVNKMEGIEVPETEIDEDESQPEELEALKSEFSGNDYQVVVSRLSDDKTNWEKIKTYSLDQFTPDLIAELYGGGKFRFKIIDNRGKFVRQWTITYAKPIKKDEPNPEQEKNEMMEFIRSELQSRDQLLAKLIEVANRPAPQPQTPTLTEMIQVLSAFQQIAKANTPSQAGYGELLNGVKTILEISKEITPERTSEEETDLGSKIQNKMIETLLPKVLTVLSGGKPSPEPTIAPHPFIDKPKIPKEEIKEEVKEVNKPNFQFLNNFEKSLFEFIEKNKGIILNPPLAFLPAGVSIKDIVVSSLEKNFNMEDVYFYLKDNSINRIFAYIPELSKQRELFEQVEADILNSYTVDVEDEPEEVSNSTEEVKNPDEVKKEDVSK